MSEEILKALMELFAIIIKQDGGLSEKEKDYVRRFLIQQIGAESAEVYFDLFIDLATEQESGENKKKLTSVLDSVRTLRIGKKISKTLNQRQKVVLLVRAVELITLEYNITDQRLGIVRTMADLFKISPEEYDSIVCFSSGMKDELQDENLLIIHSKEQDQHYAKSITAEGLDREIMVLRIPSVELYFLRYTGTLEIHLNGHPIQPFVVYLFANGSSLRMPVGLPVYYSDITSAFYSDDIREKIHLEAEHLDFCFPGNVKGLNDISFSADEGNLIGIMGASGAGKTTLLNVLAGIYPPSSGHISINGIDTGRNDSELRGVLGFVPQDDLLIEDLTVFENLWYNAKFCFDNLSDEEIRKKVDDILINLGLYEKKDLRVGTVLNKTISGGQRKRLNIALELIREPSILYLDEPTSGLSSSDSENVMDLLRELTIRGKLIFVVIHQPSSDLYKMFDRVIILDFGGQLVYYGNPVEAVIHFKRLDNQVNYRIGECPICGTINPEQIFKILEARQVDEFGNYTSIRKISPGKWKEYFEKTRVPAEKKEVKEKPPVNLKIPGWFGQFLNYMRRDLKSRMSNRQYVILVLSVSPALAFILSYIIRYIADPTSHTYVFRENENIPIYIFMAIIVALFLGLIMSAEEIFRDRKILKREKFLHLSRSSYLLAKMVNIMLMSALQTLVFVAIANPMLGIHGMFFAYWFALFSIAVCANIVGLIISSAFNSAVTIYIIIPLVMIPMMVLSGAMFSFEKLNRNITSVNKVPVIAEMMPTKWAYEALMVKQFKDNRFETFYFDEDREISRTNFKSAYYIPELETRLGMVSEEFSENGMITESIPALFVLKNEILREQDSLGGNRFTAEEFEAANFSLEFADNITAFLGELNEFYLSRYIHANNKREKHLNANMKADRGLYYRMLKKYHNESVADHVKKIYEKNKIVEDNGRLYQQSDPIFLLPETTRSHFYAPEKLVFKRYFDTFYFNMTIIWLLTLAGYIILYTDILRKVMDLKLLQRKKKS